MQNPSNISEKGRGIYNSGYVKLLGINANIGWPPAWETEETGVWDKGASRSIRYYGKGIENDIKLIWELHRMQWLPCVAAHALEEEDEDLGFILRELRNLDHAHWSSLLAEGVQRQLETIHPGPNRGVKQAPLAVLTNALMPAVLVEVGFLTNREEERLISRGEFQGQLAAAMARAIREFFERYPPGQGETVTGRQP